MNRLYIKDTNSRSKLKKQVKVISVELNIAQCVVERTLKLQHNTGDVIEEGPGLHGKRIKLMLPNKIEVCLTSAI